MAWGAATQDGGRSKWRQGHNWRRGDSRNRTQGQVESFFIYNFPEEWDAKALWYQFQNYGKVVDVFVPKRLNRIWIESYKLRARVAFARRQREIGNQRCAGKKAGTDRAVMGDSRKHSALVLNKQAKKKEKSAAMDRLSIIQRKSANLEGKSSEDKEGVMNSGHNREEIIEFCPLKEENQWLQGSMIVVVKSMSMISIIQERLDVDGGLINISPLGGRSILLTERLAGYLNEYVQQHKELFELWFEKIHSWDVAPQNYGRMVWVRISGVPLKAWSDRCFEKIAASLGEVVLVHEDTKSKSILCDGRVMILCSERNKIVKTLKLKVEETLYQIGVTEEEWRADPDWWLSEVDRREEAETISDNSLSEQGEEYHDFNFFVIQCDDVDDVDEIDGERLKAKGNSNSKKDVTTESKGSAREVNKELDGLNNQKGLIRDAKDGPEEEFGLNVSISQVQESRDTGNGPKIIIGNLGDVQGTFEGELNNGVNLGNRDSREKKKKDLKACYPQEKLAGCEVKAQERSDTIMQRHHRNQEEQQKVQNGAAVQDQRAGSSSLSDGCIAHRNKETKLEMVQGNLCKMMWFSDEFDWVMKESIGASGGEWGQHKLKCNLVNIYAPNDRQKKLKLWEELRHMIVEDEGRWLIAGDFNVVRCANEKKGKSGETTEMRAFDDFIVSTDLVDLKLVNRRFTWYRPDGSSMSRLDRVLMSDEMCNLGREWVQQGLKRTVSDHCPIMVKTSAADWGPKPFRMFDAWQQHPQFRKAVEDKWKELNVEGYAGYRCLQKLRRLKEFLKGWNKEVFGNMETQFKNVAEKVERIDLKNEVVDLEGSEVKQRKEGFQQIWDMLRLREAIWKQKSRSDWVKLGDQNTRYFHKVANGRKALNSIQGIMSDGHWVEEPIMVKKEVMSYFRKLFQEESWDWPKPSNIDFKKISEEQMVWLERPFTVEEIEEGLKSCDGSKAPGPDGFGFGVKWRGWIKECLSTTWCSVLVNGSPTEEFYLERGLRQGDPLSPFLFLMIMEGLNGLVKKAGTEGLLQGIEIGKRGLTVSLLQFADDTVILGRAASENILMVKAILRWFEIMSGLRINYSKSSIYGLNVKESWVRGAVGTLRCGIGVKPFSYLGMPIGENPRNKKFWDPIVRKFCGKLAVWKSALLSFGGRLTLLQSLKFKGFFLWGGGDGGNDEKREISWVKWEDICGSKVNGGLGVPDLHRRNWALLGKWWYRLGDGKEGLWKRVVKEKYYGGGQEVNITDVEKLRVSKIWGDILSIGGKSNRLKSMLVKGFKWEVGDGSREFGFWEGESWRWEIGWRRKRMGREQDEEKELWKVLGNLQLRKYVSDYWKWRYDVEGRLVPSKGVEEVDHLFCTCMEAWVVWVKMIKWWGMELVMPDTVKGVAETFIYGLGSLVGKEMGAYIFLVTAWYLWYRRNVLWQSNPLECARELKRYKKSLKMFNQQQK
ncbi:hypothetical protein SLEP1_g57172 [Rubroshorea leprosula]|uniref:Uncharacterized protein n=1 Tax=Rubroshorea leprosula TaxID=152421 RepID=A0AAV5MPZ0_9ROSI|nr:hypothetical protein SLEP1_g57172 [Rubroshorea leprosula]